VGRELGLRSGCGFPIWTGKEIGGVLEFFSDRDMQCNAALSDFLKTIGIQLGRVIERIRAEQSISHLSASLLRTQDYERRRIARELHDSTGQNLVGIKIKLVGTLKGVGDRSPIGAELTDCCRLVDECVKEIRTISHLLHPPLLDELGLAAAIRYYAEGYAERSGVEVNVSVDPGLGRLDRDIELAFFRIIQEALTNIHRHSGSHTARIKIGRNINETFVEIADSGKGMPDVMLDRYGNVFGKMGVGIASMRERIDELNGRLRISSTSRGTVVWASVPRKRKSETQRAIV
jgi:signal transduction histidine kinase